MVTVKVYATSEEDVNILKRGVTRGVARIFLKGVLSLASLARPFLQLVRCIVLASLATLSAFSLET